MRSTLITIFALGSVAAIAVVGLIRAYPRLSRMGTWSRSQQVRLSIELNERGQPTRVESFYYGSDGRRIPHGEAYLYNWLLGTRTIEEFQHGELQNLETHSIRQNGQPLNER
jgi:hypothetical protein